MKQFLLSGLLIALVTGACAQNLVPNPSFEDTLQCPPNGRLTSCAYWQNCKQTPDYLHACAQNVFGVPHNVFGYQPAATGNAYCAIWTYAISGLAREHIGVPLTQPMVIGHTYEVSFKCAPGSPGFGYCLQTNQLGIRFSTVAYDSANPAPIDNFAHVYTNDVITDTADWTTVSGSFTADSAYTFLVLGNFFDDANTDTIIPGFQCAGFAVYYIDDIIVLDSTTAINEPMSVPFTVFNSGNRLKIIAAQPIENVTVFNDLGQQCYSGGNTNINTSSFPPGVYILRIHIQNQTFITKCFIP